MTQEPLAASAVQACVQYILGRLLVRLIKQVWFIATFTKS
jgi:hypothetical protein